MDERRDIDMAGGTLLAGFSLLLGFNNVVIKVTNGGFGPVFGAGLRSLIALALLAAWMRWRGTRLSRPRGIAWAAPLIGVAFSVEFICLYNALDLTTVARASVIFYSMPVWLALVAHFTLPGERLSRRRAVGLALAMAGVAVALLDRAPGAGGNGPSLAGDLLALGAALGWGSLALCARLTPMAKVGVETLLFWQLAVSAPILLGLSPLFGPLIRDMGTLPVAGLAFQSIVIAFASYLLWFRLLMIYPASGVASFSFLSPVFSVTMAWAILGEEIRPSVLIALALVAVGLVLINRRRRRTPQVPQNV